MRMKRFLALILALIAACSFAAYAEDAEAPAAEGLDEGWSAALLLPRMAVDGDGWLADTDFRSLFTAMYILETYAAEGAMTGETMTTFGIPAVYLYFADENHDEIGIEMYFTSPIDGSPAVSIKGVYSVSLAAYTARTGEGLYDHQAHLDSMVTEGEIAEYFIVTPEELQNGMMVLQMLLGQSPETAE